jgi:hydroxyethylthiazole kinase-like uncharacterized protein yjeF
MDQMGLVVARFAMAVAPHAQHIWIVCGRGKSGASGYAAAHYLQKWGKQPVVTRCPHGLQDQDTTWETPGLAEKSSVVFSDTAPDTYDLCIDALIGIDQVEDYSLHVPDLIALINSGKSPVLAVDVPAGLNAETGEISSLCVRADFTLCLGTLRVGPFTAGGRDACGEIWFNDLGLEQPVTAIAHLIPEPLSNPRAHRSHKGSYGDVGVVGGSTGMVGAAILAATGALYGGAGRIYVGLLDQSNRHSDFYQPELMFRQLQDIEFERSTIVAGCGGGKDIQEHLEAIIRRSSNLVLDADALNAIAHTPHLQNLVARRKAGTTVMTPHPLEAARLMALSCVQVQAHRITMAQAMADRFACTVVLKGSGTIVAAPEKTPGVNLTGNARLASAGTGDVLAGFIGARIAAGGDIFTETCNAVYLHGRVANAWNSQGGLTALRLAQHL